MIGYGRYTHSATPLSAGRRLALYELPHIVLPTCACCVVDAVELLDVSRIIMSILVAANQSVAGFHITEQTTLIGPIVLGLVPHLYVNKFNIITINTFLYYYML